MDTAESEECSQHSSSIRNDEVIPSVSE